MCPGKLDERDGASLLRDRVRTAFQAGADRPFTEALKEAAPYGDHDFQFSTYASPHTLKVTCTVRCRTCTWCFRAVMDFLTGASKEADKAVMEATFYRLLRRFCEEVDRDCKTASLMAVVTSVHDR